MKKQNKYKSSEAKKEWKRSYLFGLVIGGTMLLPLLFLLISRL